MKSTPFRKTVVPELDRVIALFRNVKRNKPRPREEGVNKSRTMKNEEDKYGSR